MKTPICVLELISYVVLGKFLNLPKYQCFVFFSIVKYE